MQVRTCDEGATGADGGAWQPSSPRETESAEQVRTLDELRRRLIHELQPATRRTPKPTPRSGLGTGLGEMSPAAWAPPSNEGAPRSHAGPDPTGPTNRTEDSTLFGSTTPTSSCSSEDSDEQDSDEQERAEDQQNDFAHAVGCIARLEVLDRDLNVKIELLTRALEAADEVCNEILHFFGLEAPSGPRRGGMAVQVLDSLAQFTRQLRGAWEEVERHQSASRASTPLQSGVSSLASTPRNPRRRPSPRSSTAPLPTQPEAAAPPGASSDRDRIDTLVSSDRDRLVTLEFSDTVASSDLDRLDTLEFSETLASSDRDRIDTLGQDRLDTLRSNTSEDDV